MRQLMAGNAHRISKILKILFSNKEQAQSISELRNEIYERYRIDVTRKTIVRDIEGLLEKQKILVVEGYPKRYYGLSNQKTINVELTCEELELVKSCLGEVRNSNLIKSKLLNKLF